MVTEFDLPYPPSVNHYFSYYQGRPVLSKDARTYRHQVRRIAIAKSIKPLMGPIAIRIDIAPPDDRRRDCDNVQKAVIDALQHAGVFWDDSQVVWLFSSSMNPNQRARSKCRLMMQNHKRFLLQWRSLSHVATHAFQSPHRSAFAESQSRYPIR